MSDNCRNNPIDLLGIGEYHHTITPPIPDTNIDTIVAGLDWVAPK